MASSIKNNLPVDIQESLKYILHGENFTEYNIDWRPVSIIGSGNLTQLYEIDVFGKTKHEEKELNLFVKKVAEGATIKVTSIPQLFSNEIFVYKELFNVFSELENEAKIPQEKRFKTIKIYDQKNEKFIVMDNVVKKGYITNNNMSSLLPMKFYEMAVQELAKFHALSFALKVKRQTYFNDKIKPLTHHFIFGEDWNEMIQSVREVALNTIDAKLKDKLNDVFDNLMDKFSQYLDDDSDKVCLVHGEYKFDNIFTTANENENESLMPSDYQMIHYGCPAFDLMFLIFTGTDSKFRKANISNLKELYYNMLSKCLRSFSLDIDDVYPRENFEKVFREKLDYGLMIAVLYMPFMLVSGNDVPNISKSEWPFKFNDSFKERYQDTLEDFIESGYL